MIANAQNSQRPHRRECVKFTRLAVKLSPNCVSAYELFIHSRGIKVSPCEVNYTVFNIILICLTKLYVASSACV